MTLSGYINGVITLIDTIELTITTNRNKAKIILSDYYQFEEVQQIIANTKGKKVSIPIQYPGITDVSFSHIDRDYYRLYLIIEPQSLIIGRRTIDVFDCSDESIYKLRNALPVAIKNISSTLPSEERWTVSRIDYTVNLLSENVEKCVYLAKKGRDPYRYKDTIKLPGSSYRKSKTVILNFYDKLDHIRKNTGPTSPNAYLMEEAKNIFRIEIQCLGNKKLRHIKDKYKLPTNADIYDYLRSDIAKEIIFYYYKKVIGMGDYYTMSEAINKIQNTPWSRRKQENIIKWLRLIAHARSISKAREQFITGTVLKNTNTLVKGSLNTFGNYIKSCEAIDLNPVTIPKDWEIKYIPNPIKSLKIS